MYPIKLSKKDQEAVLAAVPPKLQAWKILKHLLDNPRAPRTELEEVSGALNLPNACKTVQPELRRFGLAIGAADAAFPIRNHLNEYTTAHEWSLCKLTPDEFTAPFTGPDRPQIVDPARLKRRKAILELIQEGYDTNEAVALTRNLGIKRHKFSGAQ